MNKSIRTTLCLTAFLTVSGCINVNELAGLGVISEEALTFDGVEITKVSPSFLFESARSQGAMAIRLGAHWSDAEPDYVALKFAYASDNGGRGPESIGLEGIEISVDGVKSAYDSSGYNTISKTLDMNSMNSVVIPFVVLEQMVNATDCRLRIQTTKGYLDSMFSIERLPNGLESARLSLREFITIVKAKQAAL